MRKWTFTAMLAAIGCVLLLASSPTSAQEAPQPLNSQDQYEGQIARVNGLDELAELGISGPEDFDYCDAEGCYILGPTDKEFFFCDPDWRCEYRIWPSSALSAEDFDYLDRLYNAGRYPDGEEYGEGGVAYACGSGEVCLIVASYSCDPSGDCEYRSQVKTYTARAQAGVEDVIPGAGRDANRAYAAFRRALEDSPSATRTALASDDTVTSGTPPASGDSGERAQGESGPDNGSASDGNGGDSDQDAANGNSGYSPEKGGAGAGDSDEQATGNSGSDAEGGAANGNGDENPEQGNAGAGDADSASSGSSGSAEDSSFLSSAGPQSVALGAGVLALLAGGVVLAVRLLRS